MGAGICGGVTMTKKEEREFRKLQIENEELKKKLVALSAMTGMLMMESVSKNVAHRQAKEMMSDAIKALKEAEL